MKTGNASLIFATATRYLLPLLIVFSVFLLVPASGFQSLQFRLIEVRLGLSRERRASQYAHSFDRQLSQADRERLRRSEAEPALLGQYVEALVHALDRQGPATAGRGR